MLHARVPSAIALVGLMSTSLFLSQGCGSGAPGTAEHPTKQSNSVAAGAGSSHFTALAGSSFDVYTSNPSADEQQWMRDHYWRMLTYPPYFDSRTSWYPSGWAYFDSYAIYPGSDLPSTHPEWILKDGNGADLYIQYDCSGGTCPQYAADIGNPAYVAYWISAAKSTVAKGYEGLFVDDVNLDWRISDGWGNFVDPIDPRTGQPMTLSAWRGYFADFMEQLRAALPTTEIVHNALWFVDDSDPDVARELDAANVICLERGANDAGLTGGTGPFGYESLLAYVDRRHAKGVDVFFDSYGSTRPDCEYNLASYYLVSGGSDASGCLYASTPDDWWPGYDASIGDAVGPRYVWNGVLRRDFTHGTVLVNEPGASSVTVDVGSGYSGLDGQPTSSVSLGAGAGIVLVGSGAAASATISGPSPVAAGANVAVSWANVRAAWWNDYVILCPAGAANGGACIGQTRLYADSCSPTKVDSGHGTPTGSCSDFQIPAGLAPGNYEYRYYRYDGWYDLQASAPVVVTAARVAGPPSASPGQTVTVSWTGVNAPWWNDYLILCPASAADAGGCDRTSIVYATSCSANAVDVGHGLASGSCSFTIPADAAAGDHEYRYYQYDSWTNLAAAAPVMLQ